MSSRTEHNYKNWKVMSKLCYAIVMWSYLATPSYWDLIGTNASFEVWEVVKTIEHTWHPLLIGRVRQETKGPQDRVECVRGYTSLPKEVRGLWKERRVFHIKMEGPIQEITCLSVVRDRSLSVSKKVPNLSNTFDHFLYLFFLYKTKVA